MSSKNRYRQKQDVHSSGDYNCDLASIRLNEHDMFRRVERRRKFVTNTKALLHCMAVGWLVE